MRIKLLLITLLVAVMGFGACGGGSDSPKSSECSILHFYVDNVAYDIDQNNRTITYTYTKTGAGVWPDAPTTPMAPEIDYSQGANITPSPSTPQDFINNTVPYTVIAEDGVSSKTYTVHAIKALDW